MWAPSASAAVVVGGEEQAAKAPASTGTGSVAPGSSDEKVKLGVVVVGRARWGPESIVVSGAVVSTVKVRLAGVGSVLPAASMARTSKVWAPSRERGRR